MERKAFSSSIITIVNNIRLFDSTLHINNCIFTHYEMSELTRLEDVEDNWKQSET